MDGNDTQSQLRLLRSIVGRKTMEIEDFIAKAQGNGPDKEKYGLMAQFLENDVQGYKAIIDDLIDGTCDFTANLYEIASLPGDLVSLYNEFYLPLLNQLDLEDETAAMHLKADYASKLVTEKYALLGRKALIDPTIVAMMTDNTHIAAEIGVIIEQFPELMNLLGEM